MIFLGKVKIPQISDVTCYSVHEIGLETNILGVGSEAWIPRRGSKGKSRLIFF